MGRAPRPGGGAARRERRREGGAARREGRRGLAGAGWEEIRGAPGGAGRPAPPIRFLREERERRQRSVPAFRFDVKGCRGRIGKISSFLFVMN